MLEAVYTSHHLIMLLSDPTTSVVALHGSTGLSGKASVAVYFTASG